MEVNNETKKPGAKDVTLISMILSAIWIGLLTIIKAFWKLFSANEFGLSMNEIVLSGLIMAALFSPVYLSIILDKVRDIKISSPKGEV